jgi:outer membrane protein TolC
MFSQDLINVANIRSWKSSRERQTSSRLLVDNARELVTLSVLTGFLEALRAKSNRDSFTEQVKLAEELYKLTRDRVSQGVAAELDANRALQQVNSLEQQRQQSEQDYTAAKLTLANILQARVTSDFEVVGESAYGAGDVPDKDAAITAALASRADYRSAEAGVRAAELQVQSFRASRLPVLRMSFDNSQSGNTPVHNRNTYRVQGAIEFPVFTGGRIRGEIEEAEGALREAQTARDENRSVIATEVLTAVSGVEWALKQVDTSTGNVKLSRQEVELSRSRFAQGIADNTEVVNAQDRLTRADEARIRALYTLGLARANLARATGVAEKTYRK